MTAARFCRRARLWLLPSFALALLLSGLPGSSSMASRAAWKSKVVARQFADWSRTLNALGIALSPKELEGLSWSVAQGYLGARRAVLAPWQGLRQTLGLEQTWTLFAVPQTDPGRLLVEVDAGQGWVALYASRSETYTWRRATFDQHRMRKLIGRISRTTDNRYWDAVLQWVCREIWQEQPEAWQVRLSLQRWHTDEPGSDGPAQALDERNAVVRSAVCSRSEAP